MKFADQRAIAAGMIAAAIGFALPAAAQSIETAPWIHTMGGSDAQTNGTDKSTYDSSKTIAVQGTVTRVQWANPRVWLFVSVVAADGSTQQWRLKGPAAFWLACHSWDSSTVQKGALVGLDVHPLRDGTPGGEFFTLRTLNGNAFSSDPVGTNSSMSYNGSDFSCNELLAAAGAGP